MLYKCYTVSVVMKTNYQKTISCRGAIQSPLVYGFKKEIINLAIRLHILWIAISIYRNPILALRTLKRWIKKRRAIQANYRILKYVKANNRYFWALSAPGWPSLSFKLFFERELNRIQPFRSDKGHLQTMIFAVTSKCPLHCAHCFEWQNLDSDESLSLSELKAILRKFQSRGIDQIQLSGGEPLCRLDDTIELIRSAKPGTDFWLLTSGHGLTLEKASRLKEAGLTGVSISLDHWDEDSHNDFRRNIKSFFWVKEAAFNSRRVNLAVCLSLCAVRSFITPENLWRYICLAKELGAGFVRILEPRRVGRFAGKDVELEEEHVEILKNFYLTINFNPTYRDMPLVMYPGYLQRSYGCFGAGNRYLYVDSNGDLHACPFCQHKVGNALADSIDEAIQEMKKIGCHQFKTISND